MCEPIQAIFCSSDSRILESFIEKCGCGILMKADNGNYLTAGFPDSIPIEASKDKVDGMCFFYIKKIDKNTVALKTASHFYLSRYTFFSNKRITVWRE